MEGNSVNKFEVYPGADGEISSGQIEKADAWKAAMAGETGAEVPDFNGNKFGTANEENDYYGEAIPSEQEEENKYNDDVTDAAALINYGLDAAARELGVEVVVQKIKNFNASGSSDPIKDLYDYLGIDTPMEVSDMHDEALATRSEKDSFMNEAGVVRNERTIAGAVKAINDMKELILEVEGADPRYEELRAGAKAAGKGYFEYAVGSQYNRGLTDLFRTLAAQHETKPEVPETKPEGENEEELEGGEKEELKNEGSWEELNYKGRDFEDPNFERLNPKILS